MAQTARDESHSSGPLPPLGSWDTHIHVTDPSKHPPPDQGSKMYKVETATLSKAIENARRLGVSNMVFVQTSTYGTDNTWIIDCLREVNGKDRERQARGVVVLDLDDSSVNERTLREWHADGVRGVRVNLVSVAAELSGEELRSRLRLYAERIRPLEGWSIHVYLKLEMMLELLPLFEDCDGPFVPTKQNGITQELCLVIDHVGSPPNLLQPMSQHRGWTDLLRLLQYENCYIKISAPYRFTNDPEFAGMESAVKELLAVRKGRAVLFASDWPHTRFETTNILPWVRRCLEWCGEDKMLKERLFKDNAERLFAVKEGFYSTSRSTSA